MATKNLREDCTYSVVVVGVGDISMSNCSKTIANTGPVITVMGLGLSDYKIIYGTSTKVVKIATYFFHYRTT